MAIRWGDATISSQFALMLSLTSAVYVILNNLPLGPVSVFCVGLKHGVGIAGTNKVQFGACV